MELRPLELMPPMIFDDTPILIDIDIFIVYFISFHIIYLLPFDACF